MFIAREIKCYRLHAFRCLAQTGLGSSTAVPLEPIVDREALANDVVSILGGKVARQPEDPAVLQRLKQ
jgi:hypothetical protein